MSKKSTTAKKAKQKPSVDVAIPFRDTNVFLPAFRFNNLEFFGGMKTDLPLEQPFDLLINLTGTRFSYSIPIIENATNLFPSFVAAVNELKDIPQLILKWEDYDIPDLPPSVWHALVKDLRTFSRAKQTEKASVAVFCVGGTGRTGTALAILRSLMLNEASDPVAMIRCSYKQTAVETDEQVEYVEYVTDKESVCSGSKPYTYKNYSYNKPTTGTTGTTTAIATTGTAKPNAGTDSALKPVSAIGSTCTHLLSIPGCKGGCVEWYAKNKVHRLGCHENNLSTSASKVESSVEDDCPACKLNVSGNSSIAHTVACTKKYFESQGICSECVEDVKNNPFNHKELCSKHPKNRDENDVSVVEYVTGTMAEAIANGDYDVKEDEKETGNKELSSEEIEALMERYVGKTADTIMECTGCLTGSLKDTDHTDACNEAYFKGTGPY